MKTYKVHSLIPHMAVIEPMLEQLAPSIEFVRKEEGCMYPNMPKDNTFEVNCKEDLIELLTNHKAFTASEIKKTYKVKSHLPDIADVEPKLKQLVPSFEFVFDGGCMMPNMSKMDTFKVSCNEDLTEILKNNKDFTILEIK